MTKHQNIFIWFLTLFAVANYFLISCVPPAGTASSGASSSASGTSGNQLTFFQDKIYDERIKSVRLYTFSGREAHDPKRPAVIELGTQNRLFLEFDVLDSDYEAYEISIIHCDKDWKKSRVMPLEYMEEYNQIPLREYDYSLDTKIPFVHYEKIIPPLRLSGNYAIVVYPNDQPNNPLFSKRFFVHENSTVIQSNIVPSASPGLRRSHHQVEFKVRYHGLESLNPMQEIFAHVRQNQRFDNMISNLKAPFVREDIKELEYKFFDMENNFAAGNEFRFFDTGMRNFRGLNVAKIYEDNDYIFADLNPNKSRGTEAYSFWEDYNGEFVIANRERNAGKLEADYFMVNFTLKAPQIAEPVFVLGALTNWEMNKDNLMTYNIEKGQYEASLLLKQGFYNYIYHVDSQDREYIFEGSHFDTENDYEIFIYFREPGTRYDRLVGYQRFKTNR